MPGLTNPRKRLSESPEAHEEGPSTLSKRRRYKAGLQNGVPPDSGIEQHKPGSIVRVKMTNFCTYTNAEFILGPSLNMIIGPNGTGKSTLVCAICLGLGWGPQHLGRAKEVGEFVKHGTREADIEIELAGQPGERNPVIRRNIKRENNKSAFYLDGALSSNKVVRDLAKSFHIQVDNLCQFLPQDRVVEFSAMSPVDLLTATQQAAADNWMLEHHEALKAMRASQKQRQASSLQNKEHLKNLRNKQNAQEADVRRMEERQETLVKLSAYEKYRPFIEYKTERALYEATKDGRKRAADELRHLSQQEQPSLDVMKSKENYHRQVDDVRRQRLHLVEITEQNIQQIYSEQRMAQEKIDQCEMKAQAEKDSDKKRKADLARINNTIANLQRQMDAEPIEFDIASHTERIRERQRRQRELTEKTNEFREYVGELNSQVQERKQTIQQCEHDLQKLHSQAGQQENKLRNASRDTAAAWGWIQQNHNKFKGTVHGPPIVSCSVKNPSYADAVESVFQANDFLAFTCENLDDYKLLGEQLYGAMNLKDVNIRRANCSLASWQSPVPADRLAEYGLDGWILEFVEGPEPVLSMLCAAIKLHNCGVTLKNHNSAQFDRLKESRIPRWVAGKQVHQVSRRAEYGPKAISTTIRTIQPAKYWTQQAVDVSAENELNRKRAEAQDEIESLRTDAEGRKAEHTSVKTEAIEVKEEIEDLQREKAEKQKLLAEFQALPVKLAAQEEKKAALEETGSQVKVRLREIENERTKIVVEKGQLALDYATAVETVRKLTIDYLEAELWSIEADSELTFHREHNRGLLEQRQQRQRELDTLKDEERQLRKRCERLKAVIESSQDQSLPEELEVQQDLHRREQNLQLADLDALIESTRARLGLLHEGDPNAMRQFEKRAQDIKKLEEKIVGQDAELNELQNDIEARRVQWEPALDQLVSEISDAFSHNFSQIGAAGQVGVHKDEDFDQWAIQIQVKFRENEPLSVLNNHRQSGGERSVSTIFYLMALQSRAKAPFRVVDEINQGMDPRNERLVHGRMVDIACQENTSQYFLITPKLLHGLKYHPRMKVHTIMSGEYMPKDNRKLNVDTMVDRVLEIRARA